MVKEPETVAKKRRKTVSTSSPADAKPISSEDVYNNVINYEEAESKLRSAEVDAKLFRKTCNDIRNLLSEISELKKENTDAAENEIIEKRIQASMLFVVLKKLNRMEKYRTKAGRDLLHKEKQNVDSTQLQLHNLFYESDHLIKEVTKCLQFKSKDEEIDLVSEEEFFKNAPENIAKDITVEDPHRLQLARLEYELLQRKELARLCNELRGAKEEIAADIVAKKTQLDSLGPQLKTMLEATKPLQEALGLPIDKEKQTQARAKLLPEPLYLLYVNIYSYMQACDKLLEVSINGDEEEARQYKETHDICGNNSVDSESEPEAEQENTEEVQQKKKRHHRKTSKLDRLEQRRRELLRAHPLSVVVTISTGPAVGESPGTTSGGFASRMTLTFSYLRALHIVAVKCDVECGETVTGVSAGDLISADRFLNCLYPRDDGERSPNLTNDYKLSRVGLSGDSLVELLAKNGDLGRPYLWAQRVCGMDFLPPRLPPTLSHQEQQKLEQQSATAQEQQRDEAANGGDGEKTRTQRGGGAGGGGSRSGGTVEGCVVRCTVKRLRMRLSSRLALCRQIQKLETGSLYPLAPSTTSQSSSAANDNSDGTMTSAAVVQQSHYQGALTRWSSLSWQEYSAAKSTKRLVEDHHQQPQQQWVDQNHMFYRAIITRGSAKLDCLIAVGCDYPKSPPVLSITVNWNNGRYDADNCDAIRDMERAVNCGWEEELSQKKAGSSSSSCYVLTMQLSRLLACFDIFLETQQHQHGGSVVEFPSDKTFFKFLRGRCRLRPYKFVSKAGGIFTHY